MAVSHVKSNTIADMTGTVTVFNSLGSTETRAATDLVRPVDWNSAHNQFFTLTGNTTGNSTASGSNVIYAGSGAVSIGGSTGTLVFSSPVVSTLEPHPLVGVSTNSVALGNNSSSPLSLWPFVVQHPVSAGVLDLMFSASFVTLGNSSGRQTMGIRAGLYQRGLGASSTRLETIKSISVQWNVTGNNSSYTFSGPTSTNYAGYTLSTTNSSGVNISSGYTGLKLIGLPIDSFLSPGQYFLGLMGTNSTSSINVGISLSYFGAVVATQATALAPMGSFSSAFSTGSNQVGGRWREGYGQWSSAGSVTEVPVSINFASISASNLSVLPHMRFWRT